MSRRTTRRPVWSALLLSAVAVLLIAVLAACGSDDDEESAATMTTGGMATAATDAATSVMSGSPVAGEAEAGAIGTCLQEQTTPEMVQELRDGQTESATEVYRGCLEESLPAALVAQAEPIIQQTADCGVTASKDLTDEQMQQIESGDEATIQQLTQSTLTCVSDQLGIPLQ